jgi:hypothetical protein
MSGAGGDLGRAETRQVNVLVTAKMHEGLQKLAKAAHMPLSTYARLLLQAAYAARRGETGDRDLDAAVARVVLLWGAAFEPAAIARTVGLSEPTVRRILDAWREEIGGRVAA